MFRFILRRNFSTKKNPTASEIRQSFLDFFIKENDHTFIKSSSIIPHDDPTVAFVNAGMNQFECAGLVTSRFKSILLGVQAPAVPRAANSQKCIRVGGKHNDLETVGNDGTHHTFFEMLGSWSFGDYFKERTCSMAWQYMTETLRLQPQDLVVTYFAGDERERLAADEETAQIWRNLKVTGERLLPGSMKDNFWEMGPVGPCGPCTEIHIRLPHGLMEIWNLVFIEYERKPDGSLSKLSRKHVDTGMGLERLCSVVQNVPTTFDTDLFSPLFSCISKVSNVGAYGGSFDCGSEMDRGFRILADHSRAVSVALADGMFPDQNHKLRRLLRRSLHISEQVFKQAGPHLTSELVCAVTKSLGDFYPELQTSLSRSLAIVANESEAYNAARRSASVEWRRMVQEKPELADLPGDLPGLPTAVAELKYCYSFDFPYDIRVKVQSVGNWRSSSTTHTVLTST
ncbi:hypothetical protein B566_EDAN012103 [Ephemera danica]|nr:hypothetical protein B566_EDAN012103 [Ephemera danica]